MAAMTLRTVLRIARIARVIVGWIEWTTRANTISPAVPVLTFPLGVVSASIASFTAATANIVSPVVYGLDRTLRTWVRGAAPTRRMAPTVEATKIAAMTFD